jgi:hypothetical protein
VEQKLDAEAELKRLMARPTAGTPQARTTAGSAVEQKLDAIIRRLDQMDKRLADLERSKRP